MSTSPSLAGGQAASCRFVLPPLLRPGDRVRVVAPCGPFARSAFDRGIAWLREIGLEPIHDEGVFARTGYLAGDDGRRLAELARALDDDAAAALWVARGGYGAMRLLGSLDPARVARRARWLVGFSDVTALHALWARAGVASVHGANLSTVERWQPEALEHLRAMLFDGAGQRLAGRLAAGPDAPVAGPLLGGNVALTAALVGTGCLPDLGGAILLIEDVNEAPYRLDRLLTQLLLAGVLERVAGFAIGHLTGCDDREGDDPRRGLDVVVERLGPLGKPVLVDLPIGHGRDSAAVTLGAEATLDGARGELRIAPR